MAIPAKVISLSVNDRVDLAIKTSMDIYMNKIASNFIEVGLENTFQMSLALIIQNELDQHTYYDNERFIVKFEKNMPINGNRDYIDIVVEHKRNQDIKIYLIGLLHLKNKSLAQNR